MRRSSSATSRKCSTMSQNVRMPGGLRLLPPPRRRPRPASSCAGTPWRSCRGAAVGPHIGLASHRRSLAWRGGAIPVGPARCYARSIGPARPWLAWRLDPRGRWPARHRSSRMWLGPRPLQAWINAASGAEGTLPLADLRASGATGDRGSAFAKGYVGARRPATRTRAARPLHASREDQVNNWTEKFRSCVGWAPVWCRLPAVCWRGGDTWRSCSSLRPSMR